MPEPSGCLLPEGYCSRWSDMKQADAVGQLIWSIGETRPQLWRKLNSGVCAADRHMQEAVSGHSASADRARRVWGRHCPWSCLQRMTVCASARGLIMERVGVHVTGLGLRDQV